MSLAKIPLAIAAAWCYKQITTSPNPPPSKKDSEGHISTSNWLESSAYTSYAAKIARRIQSLVGLAEVMTILAYKFPSSPASKTVLSALSFTTSADPSGLRPTPVALFGVALLLLGTFLRLSTYRHLGRFFRFEASIQVDHELITSGPYSVVRHPSYSALLLTHPGWMLWQFGKGSWIRQSGLWYTTAGRAAVSAYVVVMIFGSLYLTLGRMPDEDKALRERFGKKWDEWAERVPYRVIPGVW
ncbi:hypothetical protein D9613_011130 [Agrocybe pediades]|uniref:Protein-S-isoprenylcysteine O-methyltransferase n=1 Tax=Agrocybe pediades TaxID=84607 RepID=A0A8H4QKQ3_9AGAR|nr:hypothetical protein D9613_011130 [Agrocybe pediades]